MRNIVDPLWLHPQIVALHASRDDSAEDAAHKGHVDEDRPGDRLPASKGKIMSGQVKVNCRADTASGQGRSLPASRQRMTR